MSEKKKHDRISVTLVKEKADGTETKHYIGSTLLECILIVAFIILVVFICKTIYDSMVIKDLRKQLVDQMVIVNNLTDENETLTVENDTLISKVELLSQTVTKKTASEEAYSQEEIENALPKGFPLSGSATMEEGSLNDKPILKFKASTGVNVVCSGSGVVLSVEDDADYGNKIVIDHGNGYKSVYRNSGEVLVKTGDTLGKGYILFTVGESNQDVGYQIMSDEDYINPMDIIEIQG